MRGGFDFRGILFRICLLLALGEAGCVTKAKARAQAQQAFFAGQQEARSRPSPAQGPSVTLVGPVQNPTVPWDAELTLAKAIVAAGYVGRRDPRQIMIVRNGQAVPVEPKQLLKGEDIPLVSGDMIVLQP
jgi:hypothetical protein